MAPPRKESTQASSRVYGPIVRPGKTPRFISPDEIYASAKRAYSTNGPMAVLRHCEQNSTRWNLRNNAVRNYAFLPNDQRQRADLLKGKIHPGASLDFAPGVVEEAKKINATIVGIGSKNQTVSGGVKMRSGYGWTLLKLAFPPIEPLYAISPVARSIVHAVPAFFDGFASELSAPDVTRLTKKIRNNPTDLLATPILFAAGAVEGVVTDVLDALKAFYDLIFNSYAIGKAIYDLVEAILDDPKYAKELGKQVGSQVTDSMNKLFGHSLVRFSYEIGKLLGPMLFYTVLAIFGFPYVAFLRFGTFLMTSKTIANAVRRLEKLFPDGVKVALGNVTDIMGPFNPTLGFKKAAGMTEQHFNIVLARARSNKRIIGVRTTNNASTHWIEKGHGAKPFGINANTDKTGFVIAEGKHIKEAHDKGFYVVGDDLTKATRKVTKKNGEIVEETVDLTGARWPVAKGQIIPEGNNPKALVGDYDGQDLIDPKSPGSNVSLAVDNDIKVKDVRGVGRDGIGVTKVLEELNADFLKTGGQERFMHGFEGNYRYYKGSVCFFFPDGKTMVLTEKQVMAWYVHINRKTRNESHHPSLTPFTPEELKKMAAANDGKPKLRSIPLE